MITQILRLDGSIENPTGKYDNIVSPIGILPITEISPKLAVPLETGYFSTIHTKYSDSIIPDFSAFRTTIHGVGAVTPSYYNSGSIEYFIRESDDRNYLDFDRMSMHSLPGSMTEYLTNKKLILGVKFMLIASIDGSVNGRIVACGNRVDNSHIISSDRGEGLYISTAPSINGTNKIMDGNILNKIITLVVCFDGENTSYCLDGERVYNSPLIPAKIPDGININGAATVARPQEMRLYGLSAYGVENNNIDTLKRIWSYINYEY